MTALAPTVRGEIRELQIPSFTKWDRVGSIDTILADLEAGTFFDASLLVTQMMRDDRIRGTFNVRVHSVLGMPWHMEAAEHSAKSRAAKIADEAEGLWPVMAPEPEMAQLLTWAVLLGATPGQQLWERTAQSWLPSFRPWHPGAMYYDTSSDVYKLQFQGGIMELRQDDPNWFVCTPFGYKYGRLNGLITALAMPYLCRQWAFRDRARHSERHGLPFLQLIAPASATPAEVSTARRAAAVMGSETVIATKQGELGNQWDIKLIEATSSAHQTFSSQLDHLDDVIAVTILGQTMSTKGQPGLGSQNAAGDVVRRDVMRFDARIISWVAKRLLRAWALKNYGDADLAPKLVIDVDPPADEKNKADVMVSVGVALTSFAALGVNVDVAAIMEESGIPMLPGEPVTEPEPSPATPTSGTTPPGAEEESPVVGNPGKAPLE